MESRPWGLPTRCTMKSSPFSPVSAGISKRAASARPCVSSCGEGVGVGLSGLPLGSSGFGCGCSLPPPQLILGLSSLSHAVKVRQRVQNRGRMRRKYRVIVSRFVLFCGCIFDVSGGFAAGLSAVPRKRHAGVPLLQLFKVVAWHICVREGNEKNLFLHQSCAVKQESRLSLWNHHYETEGSGLLELEGVAHECPF